MMVHRRKITGLLITCGVLSLAGCVSIPHLVMPQRDIKAREINAPTNRPRVLIASRSSDYKKALVKRIAEELGDDSAYVKVRGLKRLAKQEQADSFDVVVLINTCMAWDMDRNVKKFLRRNPGHDKLIVLTTSAGADWLPRKRDFDALSGASEMERIEKVVDEIVGKVREKTGDGA